MANRTLQKVLLVDVTVGSYAQVWPTLSAKDRESICFEGTDPHPQADLTLKRIHTTRTSSPLIIILGLFPLQSEFVHTLDLNRDIHHRYTYLLTYIKQEFNARVYLSLVLSPL